MRKFQEIWEGWLGQLTFILVLLLCFIAWPVPTAIFGGLLIAGMFHGGVLSILREVIGQINDTVLGTPEGDVRRGGAVQSIQALASRIWGLAKKPFQPREVKNSPPPRTVGRKAAFLTNLASLFEIVKLDRAAKVLHRRAQQAAQEHMEKQELKHIKQIEEAGKPLLSWTHLIGAVVLTVLFLVFTAGEFSINSETLFGMMGVEVPDALKENQIFSSFEMMTTVLLISTGILFGIYISDLLGFMPLLPLHFLPIKVKKGLFYISVLGLIGVFVVQGSLALYRSRSIQEETLLEEMSPGGKESSGEGDVFMEMEDEPKADMMAPELPPMGVGGGKLISICLVGITVLAAFGAIMAFYGPVVLLGFVGLGVLALVGGSVFSFSVLLRLLHRLTLVLLGIVYSILNFLLRIARMVAMPFVRLFSIKGVDGAFEEGGEPELKPAQERHEVPQPPPVPEEDEMPFAPTEAEWNPIDEGGWNYE